MRMNQRFAGTATQALRVAASALAELAGILREALAIPAQAWLAAAEIAGAAVLAVWGVVEQALLFAYHQLLDALEWAQRRVRPAHGVAAVCLAAALALAGSQLLDYRGVTVATSSYAEVEAVASAPEVDRERPGAAHGWAMLPLAAAALAMTALALRGRWRVARLLSAVGVAVIAISLLVDVPRGLDERGAALAYEGTDAVLLAGFWAQLAAGAVLLVGGPLLAAHLRPGQERGRALGSARGGARARSSPLGDPPMERQGTG